MTDIYTSTYPTINLHKKTSTKSEIITQIIYGENFTIIKRKNKWLQIKILGDNYKGFILNKKFKTYLKPTHKTEKLRTTVYYFPNGREKKTELTFNSKIKIIKKKSKFLQFYLGWIKESDVKPINYKEKNFFKKIKLFKNVKYKWGGKSFRGIDCSALIQVCLNFNNRFCQRDTKKQIKYFKKNVKLNSIKKNDIFYWKGHVAVALSKSELIHAYGPKKKTIIMNIKKTINIIKKTAKLKILKIKRIN